MPGPNHPQLPEQQISCSLCHKEIPLSSALTPQGAEYIGFFCGMECYQEFVDEQQALDAGLPPPPRKIA